MNIAIIFILVFDFLMMNDAFSKLEAPLHESQIIQNGKINYYIVRYRDSFSKKMGELKTPCISSREIDIAENSIVNDDEECVNITNIPDIIYHYDGEKVLAAIPYDEMNINDSQDENYIPQQFWDEGINAIIFNYDMIGNHTSSKTNDIKYNDTLYVNLMSGVNINEWRLRNDTIYNNSGDSVEQWKSASTYLQRNLVTAGSDITIGDISTSTSIFDNVKMRGVQLISDEKIQPDSEQGYFPTIHGVVRSSALVTVKQGSYILYQKTVPPGSFSIDDISPTGQGDLIVSVRENNGKVNTYIVHFSFLPILIREGKFKYSLSYGKYLSYFKVSAGKPFLQATLAYGMDHGLTIFGGLQASTNYQSGILGIGKDLAEYGAFSVSKRSAESKIKNNHKSKGQALNFRYNKNLSSIGGNISVSADYYTPKTYYSLNDVMDNNYSQNNIATSTNVYRKYELDLSQDLFNGDLGYITLSLARERFSDSGRNTTLIQVSYNNSWNAITYGVQYGYNQTSSTYNYAENINNTETIKEEVFGFNISISLSSDAYKDYYFAYATNSIKNGNTNNTLNISGSNIKNGVANWNVNMSKDNQSNAYSGSADIDYQHSQGDIEVGYDFDRETNQFNYGFHGGGIIHKDEITLSRQLGDTVALVKSGNVGGVAIKDQDGITTDTNGYAVIPYLDPFRKNDVSLDTPLISDYIQTVSPTSGAIVKIDFSNID
jgi:outer membrane usher protein